MFLCSAALFLLGGTITHRPKDRATESKYRAYLQAYRQRWNTTQLLTAHISASLSAQTARPYTNQNKLSLVNQEIDCSKVSTPKGKRSPLNRGTLEPFKNHNQMESKNPLARCESMDTTPTQLRSDTALSQTKGRKELLPQYPLVSLTLKQGCRSKPFFNAVGTSQSAQSRPISNCHAKHWR